MYPSSIPQQLNCSIAASIFHSKHDCNSLYYTSSINLMQITLQKQIQNSLVLAVVKVPKSGNNNLIALSSMHAPCTAQKNWTHRIQNFCHLLRKSPQPPNLHICITHLCSTYSQHPLFFCRHSRSATNTVLVADRSFQCACTLPVESTPSTSLRQPHLGLCISDSPYSAPIPRLPHLLIHHSPVSASVTPPLFHFRLKTYTFFANLFMHHDSLPACRTDFTNFMTPDRLFWTTRFLFLVLFIIISVFLVPCGGIKLTTRYLLGCAKCSLSFRILWYVLYWQCAIWLIQTHGCVSSEANGPSFTELNKKWSPQSTCMTTPFYTAVGCTGRKFALKHRK